MASFDELAGDFLVDANERITQVEEILLSLDGKDVESRADLLLQAKRELHTLKGNAGMMGFAEVQSHAHAMEDEIEAFDPAHLELGGLLAAVDRIKSLVAGLAENDSRADSLTERAAPTYRRHTDSVRVPFDVLDALVDVLAEMVIFRNRLSDSVASGPEMNDHNQAWEDVQSAEEALSATLDLVQSKVMGLRMVPLSQLFVSLRRIVHDVQTAECKQIDFQVTGGDTPMDKALLEVASEALGHLVRNAAVHGIERPNERLAAGKSAIGRIDLMARPEANHVVIDVVDDGCGLDPDLLNETARRRGMETTSADQAYSLIFQAGFSTRGEADLESGRGMGLSAAMESVQRLGGRITVRTERGRGSCFRLHLPLSVSITRALIVAADEQSYAIPITHIEESHHYLQSQAAELNHALVHWPRGEVVPLLDLGLVFGTAKTARPDGMTVVVEAAGRRRGLLVDRVAGIREIVVKGLDPVVGSPIGISGSTILGDGRVVLILDPNQLMQVNPSLEQGAHS